MNKGHILIVGDKSDENDALRNKLKDAHYRVEQIASAERALKTLHKGMVDLIIADFQRSPTDSLGFLDKIKALNNTPPVVIAANQPNIEQAVAAIKAGALDYLANSENNEQLFSLLEKLMQPSPLSPVTHLSTTPLSSMPVAVSPNSIRTLNMADQVAKSDATVLITGESGTGKEVLARYIHKQSPRAKGPFIGINCAAIPENLLESELFGHTKGAFTGASSHHAGRFEQANTGTILLDEIAELPSNLQAKLLRVLQEKEVERIGSQTAVKLDVRVLAATNQNLQELVRQGLFREDLFYRINVFPLSWAPLRERKEDILPMARHFLVMLSKDDLTLSPEACEQLQIHNWPGNARELENVIQRALVMQQGPTISATDLMLDVHNIQFPESSLPEAALSEPSLPEKTSENSPSDISLETNRKREEFKHIINTLRQHSGHRGKTAETLGVTTRTLRNKLAEMRKEGIEIKDILNPPALTAALTERT